MIGILRDLYFIVQLIVRACFGRLCFVRPIHIDRGGDTVVVLIHGYGGNQSEFCTLDYEAWFGAHSVYAPSLDLEFDSTTGAYTECTHNLYSVRFGPRSNDIKKYTARLAQHIAYLNKPRVILVGHSMGGIIAHKYATAARPLPCVTIASPLRGLPYLTRALRWRLVAGLIYEQLAHKSRFLARLRRTIKRGAYKRLSIGSAHDWIVPDRYAALEPAHHVQLTHAGHFNIVRDARTAHIVRAFIATATQ
jgi:pimeloyl-ACP methyl ester carboxylesterase